MNREEFNDNIINDAVDILNDDGVIIIPTDTVYGLCVRYNSEIAINKVYEIKKRNLNKKLPIIVDSYERLSRICDVNLEKIKKLHPFFPGKLTIVLNKKDSNETVAVRMINNEIVNKIINKLDCALALTSANISGCETSSDIGDLIEEFEGKVDMIIMGNRMGNISSTIIQMINDDIVLIREGAIPFEEIKEIFYRR